MQVKHRTTLPLPYFNIAAVCRTVLRLLRNIYFSKRQVICMRFP